MVDLSELVFGDSSLMLDFAALARRLRVRGCILHLHNPQPPVKAVIEQVGLHRLPGVSLDASPRMLAY